MEVIDRQSTYMDMVHRYNLDSALRSLVTPPRPTPKAGKEARRISLVIKTPPATKAPVNLSRSLPKGSASRNSPSKLSPCQLNGKGGYYAGAKFGERPSAADLPAPPSQWVNEITSNEQSCVELTNSLKVLLKVQS